MAIFQVSSRTVQPPGPPKKRPRRVHQRWYAVLRRLVVGGLIIAALAALLGKLGLSSLFFILLPFCVTIIMARSYLYNRNTFLLTTPRAVSVGVRKTVQNDRGSALAPAGWREKGSQAQREEYQREKQAVQEPVNDPGDQEGRPYISAPPSEACRGDPRGRPDHSQVLQAVQDPVADSFHSIMH